MSEFNSRMDNAVNRMRRQLSFDVGGATPDTASLKIGGDMPVGRDLRKGEQVQIVVTDADGEVIASRAGYVAAVTFKDKRDKYDEIESTERTHAVTLQ